MKIFKAMATLLAVSVAGSSSAELVAHRGANSMAPENTLEAFELAFKNGVKTIEGDFYALEDSNIVCVHGAGELKKYWGLDVPQSRLQKLALSDYKALKYCGARAGKFPEAKIPTLEEVFKIMPPEAVIFAEIKGYSPDFASAFDGIRKKCGLKEEQIRLISFLSGALKDFKAKYPKYKTFLLTGMRKNPGRKDSAIRTPDEIVKMCADCNADGIDIGDSRLVTKDFVDAVKKAGLEFHVWTVNNPDECRRLLDIGVDSVTTDRAAEFLSSAK